MTPEETGTESLGPRCRLLEPDAQLTRRHPENVVESPKTGARVVVSGRLQSRSFETEDAAERKVATPRRK